jgi:hypothetical protein
MTPGLLQKIQALVKDGATVVGAPPIKSPGLSDFPECDQKVQSIAEEVWGTKASPVKQSRHTYGRGTVIFGGALTAGQKESLYPEYELTAKLLGQMHVPVDFESTGPVRYTHRSLENMDIYFVSNRTNKSIKTDCIFRTVKGIPELWNPLTGKTRMLSEFTSNGERTTIPLQFDSYQSFFIVFSKDNSQTPAKKKNYPTEQKLATLSGEWAVSFDSKWGGPGKITFNNLTDWTERPEQGIKYYSGIAVYSKTFDFLNFSGYSKNRLYLDLGEVKNMARVRLNGHDLGVVWTAPWQVDITGILREKGNQLEIEVANLWPNRLIGDQQYPDDGVNDGKWPEWLIKNGKKNSARYSFTTYNPYKKDSPLLSSGLLGPVTIEQTEF